MLNLNINEKLQAVLGGVVNTNQCPITVTFEDGSEPQRRTKKTIGSITTDNVAVTLLNGVSGGRHITCLSFFNADLATVTVTFTFIDKSGNSRTVRKHTLLTLESLYWDMEGGWYATDANGNRKMSSGAADSLGISTALSTGVQASSQASSILTNQATPGSSQASSMAALTPASVSSQASSMAALTPASVSSQASIAAGVVSSQASSVAALSPASVSSQASSMVAQNPATVSSLQSAASVQSFTSTTWSTASSAVSRVKSSFTW